MGVYNVSKIEDWLDDFKFAKDKFTNTYYDDYKNSYIKVCTDSVVAKMANNLDKRYARINRINKRIEEAWSNFLHDLVAVDNRLAGGNDSIIDSAVAAKVSSLPVLKEYDASLSVRINAVSAAVGTVDKLGWSEDKNVYENLKGSMEALLSTGAVICTSVCSGFLGIFEDIGDGIIWAGSAVVTGVATACGKEEWAKQAQENAMDAISYDVVGEANKWFYENTKIGSKINDSSMIKYDSEIAQGIQKVSKVAGEIVLAAALTIATDGAATPVVIAVLGGTGFAIGAGDKAQEKYSQEDRDFWGDSVEITASGVVKAIDFYFKGKGSKAFIDAVAAAPAEGGISAVATIAKETLSPKNVKNAFKNLPGHVKEVFIDTLKSPSTYLSAFQGALENISYSKEEGLNFDYKNYLKDTTSHFATNFIFSVGGNYVNKKAQSALGKLDGSTSKKIDALKLKEKQYEEVLNTPDKTQDLTKFKEGLDISDEIAAAKKDFGKRVQTVVDKVIKVPETASGYVDTFMEPSISADADLDLDLDFDVDVDSNAA